VSPNNEPAYRLEPELEGAADAAEAGEVGGADAPLTEVGGADAPLTAEEDLGGPAAEEELLAEEAEEVLLDEPAPEERHLADSAEELVAGLAWRGAHIRELRWQAELARLLADPVWRGSGVPRGDGTPVLLIPGFLAGDSSLSVMARWLRRIGYQPRRAGISFNVRCSDIAVDRLERTLAHVHLRTGRPVAIIGHSRGGLFARALAARCPDEVQQVISLGSPLVDPFDISVTTRRAVARVRREIHRRDPERAAMGCFTSSCVCRFSQDFDAPLPREVPLTSIFTKKDGVVRWRACISPESRPVEVRGSHVGLAFNRHAYREIGRTLASPPAATP
jgi:triacylglycerol lipase